MPMPSLMVSIVSANRLRPQIIHATGRSKVSLEQPGRNNMKQMFRFFERAINESKQSKTQYEDSINGLIDEFCAFHGVTRRQEESKAEATAASAARE